MEPKPGEPVLPFATPAAFDRWLAKHHTKATVVWIKHAKKASGEASITWTEAVDVVLCYGWIDGQSRSLDDRYYLQRYTPRRAKSLWSKLNRERVGRLIESGRMQPAGLAEVERARADGPQSLRSLRAPGLVTSDSPYDPARTSSSCRSA